MKNKLFFVAMFIFTMGTMLANSGNGGNVPLVYKPIKTGDIQTQPSKSPIQIPVVYLTGNVLSFDSSIEGCTIQLLDEDENVIFSHFIEENETSLTLPSYLSGTYELQIIRGNITFYAFIEL
jgi:hypothetical protein